MDVAKSMYWSTVTADLVFNELEKDYVRISEDSYIRIDDFSVETSALDLIKSKLHSSILLNDYVSTIDLLEFDDFPQIVL